MADYNSKNSLNINIYFAASWKEMHRNWNMKLKIFEVHDLHVCTLTLVDSLLLNLNDLALNWSKYFNTYVNRWPLNDEWNCKLIYQAYTLIKLQSNRMWYTWTHCFEANYNSNHLYLVRINTNMYLVRPYKCNICNLIYLLSNLYVL